MIPALEVDGIELDYKSGQLTLDAGRAPHVGGDLTIERPDEATLALLDPRIKPRVQVTCDGRVFDLGVRSRVPSQDGAEVALTLASDEALLSDFKQLEDDATPYALSASLRDVVEYVLDEVLPGTTLEASPSVDANVTAYWALTNMATNPNGTTNANDYAAAANASAITATALASPAPVQGTRAVRWTSTAAGTSSIYCAGYSTLAAGVRGIRVQPGRKYVGIAYSVGSTPRNVRVGISWRGEDGLNLGNPVYGSLLAQSSGALVRPYVIAEAPVGAAYAGLIIETQGNSASQFQYVTNVMFYEGDVVVPFFDGATADSGTYIYDWAGDANASQSTRRPVLERPLESLLWRAGQSALEFLAPLVQAAGLRLVCDESRDWTLRDETFTADGSLSIRYAVNLIDGDDRITRDSGLWFDAAVRRYRWRDRDGIPRERIDSFALVDPPTLVSTVDIDAAYPGPGRAEYAVRRAQNRGREVTAIAQADWDAAAEQPTTIILQAAPTQIGTAQSIEFDLTENTMTVNTMTADIDEDAWLLQTTPDKTWLQQESAPEPNMTWLELEAANA